jgi:hypothetical protein
MKYKRFVILALVSAFGLVYSTYVLAQVLIGEIPNVVKPCIPEHSARFLVTSAELVTQTQYEAKDYYLFRLLRGDSQPNQPNYYTHVVQVSNDVCEVVYTNPANEEVPLAQRVPQPVANELALGQMKRAIAALGRDEFARRIQPILTQDNQQSLFPEARWALEQLGFDVPDER